MKKMLQRSNALLRFCIIMVVGVIAVSGYSVPEVKVTNGNLNKTLNLSAMAMKVKEDIRNDIYSVKDTFVGDLTGYGADCPLCTGHLACMSSLDVLHGNVNYNDSVYGDVRIVASSSNLACGSIITFDVPKISNEPVVAIVLDRGVLGQAIDLLTVSSDYAYQNVGRQEITYDVLRMGWGEK